MKRRGENVPRFKPQAPAALEPISMQALNEPPAHDVQEALARITARERAVARLRRLSWRMYIVTSEPNITIHSFDSGCGDELHGALILALRELDRGELFAAAVYVDENDQRVSIIVETRAGSLPVELIAKRHAGGRLGRFRTETMTVPNEIIGYSEADHSLAPLRRHRVLRLRRAPTPE